jgi:signal transduction histidine kinase/ActR/RegA family two-component response regulator
VPHSPSHFEDTVEIRRRAEARLLSRQLQPGEKDHHKKSEADTLRLLHELEVHQIELEMQNEELKEVRVKMEELLEKYTDLYDFAPVGYLTLDLAGDIQEANLAASNLLDAARSVLVKRRLGRFVSPSDLPVYELFLHKIFASQTRQRCEVSLTVGRRSPLKVELEGIVFASGQACRMTLTDITELKLAEADRLILHKLESTGVLAGGIAHDFNNLLTVMLLNIEMAQMLNPLADEQVRYLEEAKKSGLQARNLTAQLVTFADGGRPVTRTMFLTGLIKESVQPALSRFNARGDLFLAEDLWAANVDAGQISQVIRNLLLNACEAMPDGGVVVIRAKNIFLRDQEQPSLPAGEYVRISVEDQGGGIATDVLPKIFDPYFSTKQRGTQKGMGLGLTICHSIIQKHKGAITVETEVGAGSSFHIYLPASRAFTDPGHLAVSTGVLRTGNLLVMDDEEALREAVGQTLKRMGHTVELAPHGQAAIEIYHIAQRQDRRIDVVILDLAVREGMGGQPTLQELLKLDPGVKAIVMSGNILDPVMLEPKKYGFKGSLTKPFEARKLRDLISKVLASSAETKAEP